MAGTYENRLPEQMPEPGFYYHYKHDPTGAVNNYAYEVMGVGHHTEDDCRPTDANMLVYRPLYESFVYNHGKMFDLRPLHMFYESAEKDGVPVPRFQKIEDPALINELARIRDAMYPPAR
ncbi:MAG TPA: DUF1653 domain-containing protein [Candidatus Paceibacterota bacterium]